MTPCRRCGATDHDTAEHDHDDHDWHDDAHMFPDCPFCRQYLTQRRLTLRAHADAKARRDAEHSPLRWMVSGP